MSHEHRHENAHQQPAAHTAHEAEAAARHADHGGAGDAAARRMAEAAYDDEAVAAAFAGEAHAEDGGAAHAASASAASHGHGHAHDRPLPSHTARGFASKARLRARAVVRDSLGKPIEQDRHRFTWHAHAEVQIQSIGPVIQVGGKTYVWVWSHDKHVPSGFVDRRLLHGVDGRVPTHDSAAVTPTRADRKDDEHLKQHGETRPRTIAPAPRDKWEGQDFRSARRFGDGHHYLPIKTYLANAAAPGYVYITYNLPDVAGGGLNEGILPAGTEFHASGRRHHIPLFVKEAGDPTPHGDRRDDKYKPSPMGTFEFTYGYFLDGNHHAVFGWVASENISG